jgi:polyisoprenoid-binding protein YceI
MPWQVDKAHTQAIFSVRHLGISFISGHVAVADGELELDEANPANSKLRVRMDMDTFTTHDPNRDGHLKSPDFFDVANNPYMEFTSKRLQLKSGSQFEVVGDLKIKDVVGEVTLQGQYSGPVNDPISGKRKVGFELSGAILKKDFGVPWNVPMEGGFMLADRVNLNINAQAIES